MLSWIHEETCSQTKERPFESSQKLESQKQQLQTTKIQAKSDKKVIFGEQVIIIDSILVCISGYINKFCIVLYCVSLDSSVGRASTFRAGGRGFESRGRTIPKV